MRIAYFEPFAGAAGNMILGALIDAGLELGALERELRKLPVEGWHLTAKPVVKCGLAANYVDVHVPGEDHHAGHAEHAAHAHRRLADVMNVLNAANFPAQVQSRAAEIYRRLAQAEARVHRSTADDVLFHEVGQVDAIVDIAGAAIGLHLLGIEAVYCAPLPFGRGRVRGEHGDMPSPAPATVELLRGLPVCHIDGDAEFVTPTGAAILSTIALFSPCPPFASTAIGYGSGRSDFPFPNVLRVTIGETVRDEPVGRNNYANVVEQIQTNIDDMNPQLYEHVAERLLAAGALDVWLEAVQMKKGRPGTLLSLLAPVERAEALCAMLLAETTTIGVRRWHVHRTVLPRELETVQTSLGQVRVKIVRGPAGARAKAEFEDCRALAARDGLALTDVMRIVERDIAAWIAERPRA